MKKFSLIVILLLMLAACGDELPPSPPPPGGEVSAGRALAGMAGAMPKWAAEAKNVAVTPAQPYWGDGVVVSASNFDYIYSNGYFFNSKMRTWEKFTLQGEQVKDWLKGQAIGSLTVDAGKFEQGDNYLVIYACNKSGSQWDCNGKRWMLVIFKVMGSPTGAIPELAFVDEFVLNKVIPPFAPAGTTAEKDNFLEINVIRYDAKYKAPTGLNVLVHVFNFNTRAEVDKTITHPELFLTIVKNGVQEYKGHKVALFLDDKDHRTAVWTSGKQLIYVETFIKDFASKEIIESYLEKYPSDLVTQ